MEKNMKLLRLAVLLLGCIVGFIVLSTQAHILSNHATPLDPTNSPPVANDDSYVRHGLVFTVGPLLANDHDPDNDPMTAVLVSSPAHGVLSGLDGNSFSYRLNDQS